MWWNLEVMKLYSKSELSLEMLDAHSKWATVNLNVDLYATSPDM